MIGIYKIENKINGKRYIGQSKNIEARWEKHKYDLNNGIHHSKKLQKDWNKYGADNFKFDIIEAYESLDDKEQYYIDKYNTINDGYNMVDVDYIPNKNKCYKQDDDIKKVCIFGVLGNNFIMDKDITNMEVSVYAILRTIFYNPYFNKSYCNFCSIIDFLNINSKQAKLTKPVKNAFKNLYKNGYIKIYDIKGNDLSVEYILDLHSNRNNIMFYVGFPLECTFADNGGLTRISYDTLATLSDYSLENKIELVKLIRYYCVISRVCSNSELCGFITVDSMKTICSITDVTCNKFNKLLKELDCIYYENDYSKETKRGTIKYVPTMYGHRNIYFDNKDCKMLQEEDFNSFVNDYVTRNNYEYCKDKKIESNKKRSKTQLNKIENNIPETQHIEENDDE